MKCKGCGSEARSHEAGDRCGGCAELWTARDRAARRIATAVAYLTAAERTLKPLPADEIDNTPDEIARAIQEASAARRHLDNLNRGQNA